MLPNSNDTNRVGHWKPNDSLYFHKNGTISLFKTNFSCYKIPNQAILERAILSIQRNQIRTSAKAEN